MAQYLTGTLQDGTPNDKPSFKEEKTINKNITNEIQESIGLTIHTLDYEILTSDTTENIVLYGTISYLKNGVYVDTYFIAVLDRDYNVLYASNKYSNGASLSPLIKLDYDEEGKIWGIDEYGTTTETGSTTPRYRLIMLNNVAIPNQQGNYEINLRKTYLFPIGYNKIENFFLIKKVPDKSLYYILSNDYGYGNSYGRVVSVEINVGSTNNWYTTQLLYGIGTNDDLLIEPYNDDYILYYTSTMLGKTNFVYWVKGSAVVRIDLLNIEAGGIKIISNTKFSFINIDAINDTWTFCLYNEGLIENIDSGQLYIYSNIETYYINGLIFYCLMYCESQNNHEARVGCYDGVNYSYNSKFFGEINPIETKTTLRNNYGLYSIDCIFMRSGDNDIIWNNKLVYFTGLYNGTRYVGSNSLIPKSCEISNNNTLLFARNVYNSTINENQSNTTIVIPSSYLNDIELTKQTLYSQTNSDIVENTETITKNIYEMLFLNFINTINVKDEDTNTQYPETASYINTNINIGTQTNYNNTFIGKIRVNKENNPFTTTCTWAGSPNASTRNALFMIDFDEEISSIDFLSNDETTIYYSLDTSTWETGKIYRINQWLRVE